MKKDPYYQRQKCRPMRLVSGDIRFMRIFAEVPRGGASNNSVVVESSNFQHFWWLFFSDTLEMRPALLYGVSSVDGFSVIPKCVTLNDLERLFRVKFCFRAGLAGWDRATSRNNCVKLTKIDTYMYCQRCKSSAGTLVSSDIRIVQIFGRVL